MTRKQAPINADHAQRSGVHAWAIGPEQAEKLWALSQQLCGITLE